jgi:hypothetical protein
MYQILTWWNWYVCSLLFIIAANKTACRITLTADVSNSDSNINRNKQNNWTVLHSNLQPFWIHQGYPIGRLYDSSQWRQNFQVNNLSATAVMSALSVLIHLHFSTYEIPSLETLAPLSGFTSVFGKISERNISLWKIFVALQQQKILVTQPWNYTTTSRLF